MSMQYDLIESPDVRQTGDKQSLYPRIVSKGTVDQDEFLDRVSKFTGLSRSLLTGAMQSFHNELRDLLSDGWNVELGDMGYFSASLQCPPVMSKKEVRAASISLKNINFRASSRFKREISQRMRPERSESPSRSNATGLPEETCLKLLHDYLDKYPCINRTQYGELTGRERRRALSDLNSFIERGLIRKHGMGKLVVYIR